MWDLVFHAAVCGTLIWAYATQFLPWVEKREDAFEYEDRVLNAVKPRDWSTLNSTTLYLSLACAVAEPLLQGDLRALVYGVDLHCMVFVARMFCLYMLPLRPPNGYIPLRDPAVDWMTNCKDEPLSKDLFFSGHASFVTMNLLLSSGSWSYVHAYCFMVTPVLLVWQHVHYTVDVFVAPFISYTVWSLGRTLL